MNKTIDLLEDCDDVQNVPRNPREQNVKNPYHDVSVSEKMKI